ncbi:hypothetical protein GCM10025868_03380 [Angustibacter aerolatus]|uniref:Uncharacterized protein n=1 Tax=Angustibacter aerolatus TaxID=1162965 RepID=A0ABQ6JA98_9ACTN|nr:hypothetical protein [Angustibacter aerolatus]GMA85088.1 hypothetical protein GCM10025868_03380 [Angustibacter aerolatus]
MAELDAGVHAIGKKVIEEAGEVWMAAEHESDERTAEEISQPALPPAGAHAGPRAEPGRRLRASVSGGPAPSPTS